MAAQAERMGASTLIITLQARAIRAARLYTACRCWGATVSTLWPHSVDVPVVAHLDHGIYAGRVSRGARLWLYLVDV